MRIHLYAIVFAINTALAASAAPVLNYTAVDGNLTLLGPDGSGFVDSLDAGSVGTTPFFAFSPELFIGATITEAEAAGTFGADSPDGLIAISLDFTFSPSEDTPVEFTWDFTGLTPAEASVSVILFDITSGQTLFERSLLDAADSGTVLQTLLATNTYRWQLEGAISRQNDGNASASLTVVPTPATAVLAAAAGLVTLRKRR